MDMEQSHEALFAGLDTEIEHLHEVLLRARTKLGDRGYAYAQHVSSVLDESKDIPDAAPDGYIAEVLLAEALGAPRGSYLVGASSAQEISDAYNDGMPVGWPSWWNNKTRGYQSSRAGRSATVAWINGADIEAFEHWSRIVYDREITPNVVRVLESSSPAYALEFVQCLRENPYFVESAWGQEGALTSSSEELNKAISAFAGAIESGVFTPESVRIAGDEHKAYQELFRGGLNCAPSKERNRELHVLIRQDAQNFPTSSFADRATRVSLTHSSRFSISINEEVTSSLLESIANAGVLPSELASIVLQVRNESSTGEAFIYVGKGNIPCAAHANALSQDREVVCARAQGIGRPVRTGTYTPFYQEVKLAHDGPVFTLLELALMIRAGIGSRELLYLRERSDLYGDAFEYLLTDLVGAFYIAKDFGIDHSEALAFKKRRSGSIRELQSALKGALAPGEECSPQAWPRLRLAEDLSIGTSPRITLGGVTFQ